MTSRRIEFGSFTLDMDRRSLLRDGRPVAVSSKGMLLLQALVRSAGAPIGKAHLMEAAWPGTAVEESNLSVQIAALRKLLGTMEDGSDWILTVPRVGYRFAVLPRIERQIDNRPDQHPTSRPAIAVLPFTIGTDSRDKETEQKARTRHQRKIQPPVPHQCLSPNRQRRWRNPNQQRKRYQNPSTTTRRCLTCRPPIQTPHPPPNSALCRAHLIHIRDLLAV